MSGLSDRTEISMELAHAEARLAELESERDQLRVRIAALRSELASQPIPPAISVTPPPPATTAVPASQADKVALFGSLFRGRQDVYPRRWENARTGKSGYSPHCANEWKRGVCGFRPMPITDSGACRSPIPVQGDHRFRSKPIAERMTL
jgi:hypothetical protein